MIWKHLMALSANFMFYPSSYLAVQIICRIVSRVWSN